MESDQVQKDNKGKNYLKSYLKIKKRLIHFSKELNRKRKEVSYLRQFHFSSTEVIGFAIVLVVIVSIYIVHKPTGIQNANTQNIQYGSLGGAVQSETVPTSIATVTAGPEEVNIGSVSTLTGAQTDPVSSKKVDLNNQKIISVYAEINNTTKSDLVYTSDYFTLTADGVSYHTTSLGNQPVFLSAVLNPTQSWTGYFNYLVPSATSQYTLVVTSPDQSLKQYNIPLKVQ